MVYKKFCDKELSALGMGTMRLPVVDGNDAVIDEDMTRKMFAKAIKSGVNYFDTAWGYHQGNSEIVTGKVLSEYPRESFYIADKFPGYELANIPKVKEIFPEQLKKTGMEYFDFYLIHNVCEMNIEEYLDEQYEIVSYLLEQKKAGKIVHLGCSMHGDLPVMKRFLDKYGEHMEFVQIQLNWFDYKFQKAKEKVELIKSYGLPVWVMEPVRGGKLVELSDDNVDKLKALRPDESVAAWSFRFLQAIPEVTVTLSGMSDEAQLEDNLKTYEEDKPLSDAEMEVILSIADEMINSRSLPCTACHYCVKGCPKGIDIPQMIKLYNEQLTTEGRMSFLAPMYMNTVEEGKKPSDCIACGKCSSVCPQQIDIPEMMKDFTKRLGL